jgi:hypothetical protein
MALHFLGWILFYVLISPATPLKPPQYCFYACNSATYQLVFEGSTDPCVNEHFYKTNFYCAEVYCTEAEIDAALGGFNDSCDGVLPSFESVVGPTDLRTIPGISYTAASATANQPLSHAVIPDPGFYEIAFNSVVSIIRSAEGSPVAKVMTVRFLHCIQYRIPLRVQFLRILGPGRHNWDLKQDNRGMALSQAVEANEIQ